MKRALLVIDAQKIYTSKASSLFVQESGSVIENINGLVAAFDKSSDPIIYIRHVHKADRSDLGRMFDFSGEAENFSFVEGTPDVDYIETLRISPKGIHLTKNRYSAFVGTNLQNILNQNGIDTVFITGFMTNFCCETTARHAHDLDFFVDFVMDGTGCSDLSNRLTQKHIKESVRETLEAGFARVVSTQKILTTS